MLTVSSVQSILIALGTVHKFFGTMHSVYDKTLELASRCTKEAIPQRLLPPVSGNLTCTVRCVLGLCRADGLQTAPTTMVLPKQRELMSDECGTRSEERLAHDP